MIAHLLADVAVAAGASVGLSILVKATGLLVLAMVFVRMARRTRASVRHVILASTFGVLLMLPLVQITLPAIVVEIPIVVATSPIAVPHVPDPKLAATAPALSRSPQNATENVRPPSGTLVLAGWTIGTLLFLVPIVVGFWGLKHRVREGLPWREGQERVRMLARHARIHREVDVVLHEGVVVPMAGGVLRPTIVMPSDAVTWSAPDLRRAMVHELEHVRRHDLPIQIVARMTCAVYWFHPLAWIALRQLCLESERACDDAVLREAEGTAYADQLLMLARRQSRGGTRPLLSMANRSDLAVRVSAALDAGQRRGRASRWQAAAIIVGAVIVLLGVSPLRAVGTHRSYASAPNERSLAFDWIRAGRLVGSGQIDVTGDVLHTLSTADIVVATGSARRSVPGVALEMASINGSHDMRPFQVWEVPVYELAMARHDRQMGPKLRQTQADCAGALGFRSGLPVWNADGPSQPCGAFGPGTGDTSIFRGVTMETFGRFLTTVLHRRVLDRTTLPGYFDIDLEMSWKFAPLPGVPGRARAGGPPDSIPSIFTVLQERLGLKLETRLLKVGVIDVIMQQPTPDSRR